MRAKLRINAKREKREKREKFLPMRKKFCRFCAQKIKTIDYKDIKMLEAFIKDRGKIVSVRYSGNCAKHQRIVAQAMRRARFLSLLPYTRP